MDLGGSMSGEHGDGFARSYLNERLFGPKLYRVFQQIKALFDPNNLLNPGKIVDGPRPTEHLRYGAEYRTVDVPTTFSFAREGGFAAAAELCNGAGVCRKLQTGTMCPSFMVTRDEEHSTRGRANALRLVLSGVLNPAELAGDRLHETYDLCLQCKGCKAECPSNVDVAKLKMEFLSHYHAKNGFTLGARALGHAAALNRAGAALAPVSNWINHAPGLSWLARSLLGIDRRRPLPRFSRNHFRAWFHKRSRAPAEGRPSVVVLDDCLTSYCDPSVNKAAVRVLEAAGYHVELAGLACCGRTLVSKGFLSEAQQLARENIQRLLPWARQGVPILGCEPSCLLMLIDEYLDLVPTDAAREVAAKAQLADTFLADGNALLTLRGLDQPVLLHGHCHQKALVGMNGSQRALERIPGAHVQTLDSGCCGMAGSFGYEHYEISMQIGERVLLPAARRHEGDIAAPGFSCRQQIEHGAGRKALHPLEIVARQLMD
jgi:Fe-S oxidoreductase